MCEVLMEKMNMGLLPKLYSFKRHPMFYVNRVYSTLFFCGLIALLYHRLHSLIISSSPLSFFFLLTITLADVGFAAMWVFAQAFRWRAIRSKAFPEKLSVAVPDSDLPAIDVVICTADPYKEPPVGVVCTALSAMGFDYPPEKLSVYVSDDGGSELTLFAFMEAARFAKKWLPFCRKNGIKERNPQAYFSEEAADPVLISSSVYHHKPKGWEEMKIMFDEMKDKVERAVEEGHVDNDMIVEESDRLSLKRWTAGFTRKDHPTIIEVLLASGEDDQVASDDRMPNLIYMSREKRLNVHHHFKAGALNTLLRVTSMMTNAPIILTLDCDMYSKDPLAPCRALCFLIREDFGYVQFPQVFRGINKNDIHGAELKREFRINCMALNGLQGPNYIGTNCFFRRRVFAGKPSSPPHPEVILSDVNRQTSQRPISSVEAIEAACRVAGCNYEQGTQWGSTIGFRYGSLVEDYYTGYSLHCEGWRSAFLDPTEPSFIGEAPMSLSDLLSQQKRWCVGLLEVGLSWSRCPLTYGASRASLLVGMAYAYYAFWPLWCIPLTIYAVLPQFSMLIGIPLFPKASEAWFYLYVCLFIAAYTKDLVDFLVDGSILERWWNDQRMWMMRGLSCYLFGTLEYLAQHMGIASSGFNVTSKVADDQLAKRYYQGKYEFGVTSMLFLPMSIAAMINFVTFISSFLKITTRPRFMDEMFLQWLICGFVVFNSWPIYEAMMLRKDNGRMPSKITFLAILVAVVFYLFASSLQKLLL